MIGGGVADGCTLERTLVNKMLSLPKQKSSLPDSLSFNQSGIGIESPIPKKQVHAASVKVMRLGSSGGGSRASGGGGSLP